MRNQGSDQPESTVKPKTSLSKIWLTLVGSYYFLILVAFCLSPDLLAGITALPAIGWITLGLGLIFFTSFSTWRKSGLVLIKCFLVVGLLTSEELYIPLRWLMHGRSNASIAYISLNCAGGDPNVAREAVSRGADVVFLQESPSKTETNALAKEFGYLAFWGVDGSILTRVSPVVDDVISEQDFVAIRQGDQVFVSLRLIPPQFRLDYWSPDLWQSQRINLVDRRDQLRKIMDQAWALNKKAGEYGTIVVAGDFNAIPGQIRARDFNLHDLGSTNGVNWGGSAVNDYPLARIDRVWVTPDNSLNSFRGKVVTEKTKYSDHRMVIVYKE